MDYNISSLPVNPAQSHIYTVQEVLDNLGQSVIEKFLWIGLFALLCALWHMFKNPDKEDDTRIFITGLLDMACLVAGITGIVFYLVYKYHLVSI